MAPQSVQDIDRQLLTAHRCYCQAIDSGDLDTADTMYHQLDVLLDQRNTIPQQRQP